MKYTWTGGPTYDVLYEKYTNKLKFKVTVPKNMYFAMAFNKDMTKTDSIWFSNSSTGTGTVKDMWSVANGTP